MLRRARRSTRGTAYLLSLLLGALIFAQMLGLMHRVIHAPHAPHTQQVAAAELHHHPDDAADVYGPAWLDTLFAGHDEGSDSCRVFDQQGHSALMTAVASLALPSVLRAQLPAEGIACALAVAAAPFQARAPPSSR